MGERDRDRFDEGVGDRDRLPASSLDPESRRLSKYGNEGTLCQIIFSRGSIVTRGRSGVGVSNGNLPGIRREHRSSRERSTVCVQERPR